MVTAIKAVFFDLGDTVWHLPHMPPPETIRGETMRRVGGLVESWGHEMSADRRMIGRDIRYAIEGKSRSVEIPGIMQMAVAPIPTMHPSGEIWANLGHPAAPDRLALAVGNPGSTFADRGMRWDNSGKNGHYAPISWAN